MWRRACSRSVFTSVSPLRPWGAGVVALMVSPGCTSAGPREAAGETLLKRRTGNGAVGIGRNPVENASGERNLAIASECVEQLALSIDRLRKARSRQPEMK